MIAFNSGSLGSISGEDDGSAIIKVALNMMVCITGSTLTALLYHRYLTDPHVRSWDFENGLNGSLVGMVTQIRFFIWFFNKRKTTKQKCFKCLLSNIRLLSVPGVTSMSIGVLLLSALLVIFSFSPHAKFFENSKVSPQRSKDITGIRNQAIHNVLFYYY